MDLSDIESSYAIMENILKERFGFDDRALGVSTGTGEENFEVLDTEAMSLMYSLLATGAAVDKVMEAMNQSSSLDEFKEKLKAINETVAEGSGEEGTGSVVKYADEITKLVAETDKAQNALDA